MNIIGRTFILLPAMVLLGLGVGIFYLATIMYYVTGRLPDINTVLSHLSGLEQIIKALSK